MDEEQQIIQEPVQEPALLNAQISWAIYTVAACLSCLILIGFVLAPVVVIAWIVFSIIAAVKAANGNYDYVAPFTIKFLK